MSEVLDQLFKKNVLGYITIDKTFSGICILLFFLQYIPLNLYTADICIYIDYILILLQIIFPCKISFCLKFKLTIIWDH